MTLLLAVFTLSISFVSAARILLLGSSIKLSGSNIELLNLGEELAGRGHEIYISNVMKTIGETEASSRMVRPNITLLHYRVTRDYSFAENLEQNALQSLFKTGPFSISSQVYLSYGQNMTSECEEALADDDFMLQLKNLHFDMVVVNRVPLSLCFFLIPYHLKVPYVSIYHTIAEPWSGGSPMLPSSTYNTVFNYADKMDFWQRLKNLFFITAISIFYKFDVTKRSHQHLLKIYAPDKSSFKEVADQSQLLFFTREHVVQWPLPLMPNVISVPSLGCIPSKPLPDDLHKIVKSSKHGVIVISFGSLAEYLPREVIAKLVAAFAQIKQDVIWKFPFKGANPSDFTISKNVHVIKWYPQNDLLGHNNTKLFITHCGINGLYESIYQGIPMVAFPLFGDHHYNAFQMQYKGFGIALDITKFTSEDLVKAINEVLGNVTYIGNVKKASTIFKDAPMTPRATVAYWLEHVIKFGHHHLRSYAMDLAWYEYFMIDVLMFVSLILAVISYLTVKLLSCCCRFVCKRKLLFKNKTKMKKE